jgi:transposase-like protein
MSKRRSFSPEFKAEVANLILKHGRAIGDVCREMNLVESASPLG